VGGCGEVSILTGLERPVQPSREFQTVSAFVVSILTGLERPVQRLLLPGMPLCLSAVSILTGLERPVQPSGPRSRRCTCSSFQSSPALKDRCNCRVTLCHQGHRMFQSSPALKDRCNPTLHKQRNAVPVVSILTGLERPVQRQPPAGYGIVAVVSILTGLERPVQPAVGGRRCVVLCGFNPHRP